VSAIAGSSSTISTVLIGYLEPFLDSARPEMAMPIVALADFGVGRKF
jgi:hypothetical protein